MPSSPAPAAATEPQSSPAIVSSGRFRRLLQDRVILPLLNLLRMGASPRRLAWSLAIGAAIGLNPIVGSTTLLCLGAALLFRLNLIASQIANHLMFPLQLALVVVYLKLGERLFHTGALPLAGDAFLHAMRHRDWSTAHTLWTWQWHAIVVWLLFAVVLTPLLAAILRPLLARLLATLHHQPPAQV